MATQRQNDIARPCLPNLADAALVEGGGKGTRKQEGVRVCSAHPIRRSTFSLVGTFFRHFTSPGGRNTQLKHKQAHTVPLLIGHI